MCIDDHIHTSECVRRAFVLVDDTQWMWWQRDMARLQVCLLLIQWEWMCLTAICSNITLQRETHTLKLLSVISTLCWRIYVITVALSLLSYKWINVKGLPTIGQLYTFSATNSLQIMILQEHSSLYFLLSFIACWASWLTFKVSTN